MHNLVQEWEGVSLLVIVQIVGCVHHIFKGLADHASCHELNSVVWDLNLHSNQKLDPAPAKRML